MNNCTVFHGYLPLIEGINNVKVVGRHDDSSSTTFINIF